MNTVRRAAAALLVALPLAAFAWGGTQGSGKLATETRTVPEFQAVASSGSMDLVVRQGAQQVQVQADDNLLPLLETVVENGSTGPTLKVRWKKGESVHTRSKILVTITAPRLSAIANAGSGDVRIEAFSTPALKVGLSGSGDARFDKLTTDDLAVSISGSADVVGNGRAVKLKISIAGSGDVRLAELQADDVQVSIAGSGDASVNAGKTLEVKIAGSGDVTYTGNPSLKSSVAGSGSINKK